MSFQLSLGGMTMSNIHLNEGVHKLPKDCYPPTESESEDGEESFVVLNDPESSFIGLVEAFQPPINDVILSPASIDRSLNALNEMTQCVLNQTTLTLETLPSMAESQSNSVANNNNGLGANSDIVINGQELNLTQIQSKIHVFALENVQLKDAVKQNNIAMKDQCEKIVILQEEYKKSTEQAKTKLQESINLVQQLKTENEELKFIRDEQKKVINQLQTDLTLINKNNSDLKSSKESLDKIRMANMKSFELESTEKKLKNASVALQCALENKEMLQSKFDILETQSESIKLKHLEEIARLKEELVYFKAMQQNYDERENVQKTMNKQMTEMQKKIVESTKEMADINTKNCLLEEQLKIYQADFEEEREARRKLKQDEDQLKVDLEFVRQLNKALQEENNRLKIGSNLPNSPPSKHPVENVYVCHWCQFGFFNLNALRNHIERCPEAFEQV